jgi:Rho GDP-dissociation inhibitor
MASQAEDDLVETTPGYKAPNKVDLETLKKLDADDESLAKWKAKLLAGSAPSTSGDTRNVVVEKLSFITAGRPDIELDLTGTRQIMLTITSLLRSSIDFLC